MRTRGIAPPWCCHRQALDLLRLLFRHIRKSEGLARSDLRRRLSDYESGALHAKLRASEVWSHRREMHPPFPDTNGTRR